MIKKRLLVFVTLLCVLLGVGSVTAAYDFTLTSEGLSQETCPTVFTVYQFTVTNTGDETDIYTVSKAGNAAAWALTSPPGFVLKSGDSENIFVYVTPSRNAKAGSYSLDITVTGSHAGAKTSSASLTMSTANFGDSMPEMHSFRML